MDQPREKLRQRLEDSRGELLAVIATLGPAQAAAPTTNAGWAVRDVLAHLAGAELGHQQVIRALLAGDAPDTSGFDLDAFNAADVAARRDASLTALLAELARNRLETLALLDSVGLDDWDLAGYHPGGFDTTVEGTFRIIAIHEKRHVKEIRAALTQAIQGTQSTLARRQ
jgi:uncharacterized protein (TIGR03083 family)